MRMAKMEENITDGKVSEDINASNIAKLQQKRNNNEKNKEDEEEEEEEEEEEKECKTKFCRK